MHIKIIEINVTIDSDALVIINLRLCTVKTRHQETRLLKSGCRGSYQQTKIIKQAAQFLISCLKKLSTLHAKFC